MSNIVKLRKQISWRAYSPAEKVTYKTGGNYPYDNTITTKRHVRVMVGDVVIAIDVDTIAEQVARMAVHNKSGKSRLLGGLAQAKRLTANEISRTVEPWSQIPEGVVVLKTEELS
jgi:hypothetical protein